MCINEGEGGLGTKKTTKFGGIIKKGLGKQVVTNYALHECSEIQLDKVLGK